MKEKRFIDIARLEQYFRIEEDGAIWSYRKNKYLKPSFNTAGYLYISLRLPDLNNPPHSEKARMYAIHRLVATKFIGECPPKLETSHKDGNKTNNHYSNLEYLTHSENILKSFREHGRKIDTLKYTGRTHSDHTKELMSDAKKKTVIHTHNGITTTYPSIEDAAKALNTYRKKIYSCIYYNKEFKDKHNPNMGGFLSFA